MHNRRIQLWIAAGCLCASAVAGVPAIAAGAGGSAPAVTTNAATNVNSSGATLNGSVNPNGEQTSYAFDYGTSTAYGQETPFTSAGSGSASMAESAALSGLTPGTTYHYRIVANNATGKSLGVDETFTTPTPAPSAPAPTASTGPASQLSTTAVRVNGTLNAKGQSTTYYFQYGPTTAYGLQTPSAGVGSGTSNVAVHATLGGLTQASAYHYRLVAQSAGGTTYGADQTVLVGPTQSHVAFMGRMGFVSPGAIIGVEAGCFGGATPCTGHVTMTAQHGGALLGQRNFYIAPNSGGFQNIGLDDTGKQLLKENSVWHLLPVTVTITTTQGQTTTQTMTLARWVWH